MQHTVTSDQANETYVAQQYGDTKRLDARIHLYQSYQDARATPFTSWVFEALGLRPGLRVLEVGVGTGQLWADTLEKLPEDVSITLSDNAPAMLEAARARLGERFDYRLLDVASLAEAEASYDIVIANHMLYHVTQREAALAGIRRVLRPGGKLFATTNGWTHIIELRALIERFHPDAHVVPARFVPGVFDVEQGARELSAFFSKLQVSDYRSHLKVTDPEAIVDYVRTILPAGSNTSCEALQSHVARCIALQGHFYIGTWVGLFIATK